MRTLDQQHAANGSNRRAVVLRHLLDPKQTHTDWMVELPGSHDRRLLTFRCNIDPSRHIGQFVGTKIGDHRSFYLDFEGPISHDRGRVVRAATGVVHRFDRSESSMSCVIRWNHSSKDTLITGAQISEDDQWVFSFNA